MNQQALVGLRGSEWHTGAGSGQPASESGCWLGESGSQQPPPLRLPEGRVRGSLNLTKTSGKAPASQGGFCRPILTGNQEADTLAGSG